MNIFKKLLNIEKHDKNFVEMIEFHLNILIIQLI